MNIFRIDILINHKFIIQTTRTSVFCMSFFILALNCMAVNSYSQTVRLSMKIENPNLKDAIVEIKKQTEFDFLYSKDIEPLYQANVHVAIENGTIEDVLSQLFKNSRIDYQVINKTIVLTPGKPEYTNAVQQGITVTGTVSDKGEPVPGVNVTIQGTLTGVVTDANGKYTIIVPNKDAVLVFSFVGYSTQELPVGDQAEINIILEENVREIDEVVVVGYGTIQRKYFTGSVSTVNVANSPIGLSSRSNTMDMLRGTTVGVVTSREAESGSNPSIQIHGQKSVNGSSAPLIVLDGVIYLGSMRDIDPFSVESISVLKDATSLAAYGSQAANGVVMITTKKGKLGKPVINLNGSLAISYKTMMPELLSPEDFVRKTNYSKGVTDGNPQSWMKPTLYENYLAGNTTDWLDYSTRTGLTQNYSLSVSGASEKFNYYLSLSHIDQKGIMIGDDYSRETLNARVQNDITNWLQVGVQFNYAYNNYDGVAGKIIPYLSPYGQPTRPNGELEKYVAEEGGNHINPLWDTYKGGTVDDYERFATAFLKGHVLLKAPWIEGLTYRLNLSYSEEVYKHDKFTHEGNYVTEGSSKDDTRYLPETLAGYLSSANGFNQRRINDYYLIDNILNYTTQLNKHYIDLTAVYTRDEFTSDNRRQSGNNFATIGNTLLSYDGLSFASTQTIETTETRKANIGYLGRINYNYDGKYHLSASIRRDGSSVFGTDSKWGIFPAVGAAWTVSRENFMERVPVINYLKLRTSWGKNGNQSLSPYGTLSTINLGQIGNHPYFFGNSDNPSWGQYVSTMGNSALGWEATTAINVGFELDLLNDRIHIEFDAYKSKTVDQIFDRTIPVMGNGFNKTKATMGQVDNQGYEFTLNTINIRRSNFEWSTMLNFYLNRNKLVDLYGDGKDDIASSRFLGKSLEAIYGYKNIGIVQEDDTEYIAANTTNPGFPKYANLDGSPDGKITAEDRTILGYKKENFRMNMSHTLTYKGWELYAMFTGVFSGGGYGLDVNEDAYLTQPDPIVNINHIWWTPENRSNVYPLPNRSWTDYTPVMSYAFVRLQDLNLSYTFRQQILKDWGINHLRAYISVKNLFTITDWVGGDPETRQSFGMGRALSGYPLQKTFLFGVNISF